MTNFQSLLVILFLVFSNFWIYRILNNNFLIGLNVILVSFLVTYNKSFKYKKILIAIFILGLVFFQCKTTNPQSYTNLTADQIRIQEMRFKQYPPSIFGISFPLGYWFEMKEQSYIVSGVFKNFFENLDFNQYFLGGHPKQRVGIEEFEKFPYPFVILFILGLLKIFTSKRQIYSLVLFVPSIFVSLIGNKNIFGPFILFPFFIFTFWYGFNQLYSFKRKKLLITVFIIFSLLVLVQQYIYGGVL